MNLLIFEQHYTGLEEPGISRFGILSKYWARQGLQITIIAGIVNTITGAKPPARRFRLIREERPQKGVTILRVFDSSAAYHTFYGRLWSYCSYICSAFLCSLFFHQTDAIIVSSPPIFVGLAAFRLSRLLHIPLVLDVRDAWPDVAIDLGIIRRRFLRKLSFRIEQTAYRRADLVIVNSPGLRDLLIRNKGVADWKVRVIQNPLDSELLGGVARAATRKSMGWEDKFVIIFSGNLSAVYDIECLLRAARILAAHPAYLFVVVGGGRQRASLERYLQAESIANLSLLPPVSKTRSLGLISAADAGVAPLRLLDSLRHVYSSKLFDYMLAQKPILLLMEGVSAELVGQRAGCGICLAPGDAKGLVAAIKELAAAPEQARKLGANGHKFALENIAVERLAGEYLRLLRSVVSRKPRRVEG